MGTSLEQIAVISRSYLCSKIPRVPKSFAEKLDH